MALICHFYPGINPLNVWEIEFEMLKAMIRIAEESNS